MSKMKMQSFVAGVESRVIKEGTPEQRTIYDVIDGDGNKWVAWERELAVRANAFKGQQAIWEVEQKPGSNPKYTNRTLINIEGLGSANMHEALQAATVGMGTATTMTDIQPSGSTLTAKDTAIHRQTAAKVVAQLAIAQAQSGQLMTSDEFWTNVSDLVAWFESGLTPANAVIHNAAASLNAVLTAPQGPDDDLPF